MTLRIIVAGATGWTGSAVAKGVLDAEDMTLVGAVARNAAGQDIGTVLGRDAVGVKVSETLEDALKEKCDILIDYTKPHVVKGHAITALNNGVHVVIGTSGLTAEDFAEIEKLALAKGLSVFASGNYSITAALMTRFALMAAKHVADVEVIDYASAKKNGYAVGYGPRTGRKVVRYSQTVEC